MENTESRLQNNLQYLQELINKQVDPTTHPYVKDKSFYDKMVNSPLENTKMAAYRDNLANLDLLKIANNIMPGNREYLTSVAQGLMKQSSDAAEQDSNIRNEMTRRNTISETLQGMQNMRNPIEALTALKTLKATTGMDYNPAEVSAMYGSKESAYQRQFHGASALAGINANLYSQEQQRNLQREQMAQQERLASMRLAVLGGAGGRGRCGIEFNPKDAIAANKATYELFQLAADAKKPEERKKHMDEAGRLVDLYGALDPRINPETGNNQIIDDLKNQIKYFYAVEEQERAKNPSWEDVVGGKYSSGNKLFDDMVRGIRQPYPIEST